LFSPKHVEIDVDSKGPAAPVLLTPPLTDDFSYDIAIDKIGSKTGTKNLVPIPLTCAFSLLPQVTDKAESKLARMTVTNKKTEHLVNVEGVFGSPAALTCAR
jgi:hypothetical protein